MSVKQPLTIDNLGIQASVQYAENQKQYDPRLIEESRLIPRKSEVPSVTPYISSEVDPFFTIARETSWALFTPPPNFSIYGENLFSYQIIPSLGTQEEQEADVEKLQHFEEELTKQRKKRAKKQNTDAGEEEREREALITMFQIVKNLDKVLTLINARRNQYQRG